jgi:glycosyltransferase involved in cell wall biosynthesis
MILFAQMMGDEDVTLYAGLENDTDAELVTVCQPSENPIDFDPGALHWVNMNNRVILELKDRAAPGDFLCLTAGRCQRQIALARPDLICVEQAVGYGGPFAPYRAYPSYAWMHTILGAEAGNANQADGRFYDTVIPHAVEPQPYRDTHDGYLAYVGRLEQRKGLDVVGEIAKHTGRRVLIAGQGPYPVPDGCEHVGVVNPAERAALMGGAAALLCPTTYVEPFGLVAVEAMRCGTPVISTNWGAFAETVVYGISGYQCATLSAFLTAVEDCADIDREKVARWAARYDPTVVGPMYYNWLRAVESVVLGQGWYAGVGSPT